MALIAENGTIVARYDYDAYGKLLSVKDASGAEITDSSHIANINPIRYRGYYFDSETGFYYLNSRYYDPEICRFISPDDASLLGANGTIPSYNLYAYCENNPVNCFDVDGECGAFVGALIGGAIAGGLVSTFSYLADCAMNGKPINPKDMLLSIGLGAFYGAMGAAIGAISFSEALLTIGLKIGTSAFVGCFAAAHIENQSYDVQLQVFKEVTISTFVGSLIPAYNPGYMGCGNLCTNLIAGITTGAVMETVFDCHSQQERNKRRYPVKPITPSVSINNTYINYAGWTHGKCIDYGSL